MARLIAYLGGPESMPMTGSIVDYEQTVFGSPGGGSVGYPKAGQGAGP